MATPVTTFAGFVSIPPRPHVLFKGKPVDGLRSSPLWKKYSFTWARDLFCVSKYETLQMSDLPILGQDKRSRSLNSNLQGSVLLRIFLR